MVCTRMKFLIVHLLNCFINPLKCLHGLVNYFSVVFSCLLYSFHRIIATNRAHIVLIPEARVREGGREGGRLR